MQQQPVAVPGAPDRDVHGVSVVNERHVRDPGRVEDRVQHRGVVDGLLGQAADPGARRHAPILHEIRMRVWPEVRRVAG